MHFLIRLLVLGAALAAAPASAQLMSLPPAKDVTAELLVGGYDPADPQTLWLGLKVRLGKGWKSYWRSPGDGGLPPDFDWSRSANLGAPTVFYPAPHRIEILGLESIGYTGEVVYPIRTRVDDPGRPVAVALDLDLYVCSTICVRQDETFQATVAPGAANGADMAVIEAWRGRVPRADGSSGIVVEAAELAAGSPPALLVRARSEEPFDRPDIFVETDLPFAGGPEIDLSDGGRRAEFRLPLADDAEAAPLAGRPAVLTLVDGERAMEAHVAPQAAPAAMAAGFWFVLGAALLGGFVLNLMPCVLPVLSLKLLAFTGHDGGELGDVRKGFAASAAGIVASFLLLATALAALKAAGATVGWGIQFQQPAFLAGMAVLLTLFAASLFGLFDIVLPGGLSGRLDRAARRTTPAGHFAGGMVATLLATPCSAPFVGTAVGFALSRGPIEIYAVFATLGLGMALPYLAVAARPQLAALMPKPGRWMATMKHVLGAGLLVTAAWLVSIVAAISGGVIAGLVAAALATVLATLWLRRRVAGGWRLAATMTAAALAAGTVLAPLGTSDNVGATEEAAPADWRAWDAAEVAALVADGRTVLVDITADWCITCKVNKALVLDRGDVAERLATDVVPVQGDWTRPDDRIARYLERFGRYGLPFDVVYGPGAPEGVLLPEILTEARVLAAFAQAAGTPVAATTLDQESK